MNILIKKEIVELLKKETILKTGLNDSQKQYLNENISVDFLFFTLSHINNEVIESFKKEIQIDEASDVLKSIERQIIFNYLTSALNASVELKFTTDDMSLNEKINYLIDLKNTEDAKAIQIFMSDMLEQQINL